IVFIFFAELLNLRIEERHPAHREVGSVLQRPEDDLDDRSERENCPSVGADETVEPVEKIEQELADDFEHPKIHDFGFVAIEPREAVVNLWPDPHFKSGAVSLARRQLETRHPERAGKSVSFLFGRNIKSSTPHAVAFRRQRRDQRCEKLITDRAPVGIGEILLIKRLPRPRADSKQTPATTKPIHIDSFRLAVGTPYETRVIGIILRMNRRR